MPQPFGSTKPSCSAVRLAPKVEFASKVSVCTPCHPGSVDCTAFDRVNPPGANIVVGRRPEREGLADQKIADRRAGRVGGGGRRARFSRHGALCRTSAAIPPTCGAAADVPKNGAGNDPAPLIDTPSIAARSGFSRPSSVGPRLLKNSGVAVRGIEARLVGSARERARGGGRRRADRADRNHAHRRSAGIALRRDAARRGVVVVTLVPRRREQRRSRRRRIPAETRRCSGSSAAPRRERSARRCRKRSAAPALT